MPAATAIRSTLGRGRLFDSILDTVGDTPVIRVNNLRVDGRTIYAKAEFFNPMSSVKDRLALNVIEAAELHRRSQVRPDGGRGDQWQHRHRTCDGLRSKGLSARSDNGRQLLRRTPQAHAHAGRKGGADPASPEGTWNVSEGGRVGRDPRLVPRPTVRDRGQRRHPREHDRPGNHQ